MIQEVCDKIALLYKENVTLKDFGNLRSSEFTFGFASPSHYSEYSQDVNYLVAFYPYYNLWRKFHLRLNNA